MNISHKNFDMLRWFFQLVGESKKTLKKDTLITWTKNNEPWHPDEDGTDKLNGFMIR